MRRRLAISLAALAVLVAAVSALLGPRDEPAGHVGSEDGLEASLAAQGPPQLSARAGASTSGTQATSPTIALVGRVLDDRRFPAAGATVEVLGLSQPRAAGATGADGRFRAAGFERPAAGWRSLVVLARDASGRVGIGQTAFLMPGSPDVLDTGEVILDRGFALAVKVVDSGAPVPAAHVALQGDRTWLLEATTGPDGVARFDSLPARSVEVLAWTTDPARAGRGFATFGGADADPVTLPIAPARTVEVTVVEAPSGRPIEGATLRVAATNGLAMGGAYGIGPPSVEPTNADGETRIEGTIAEDVLLLARVQAAGFDGEGYAQEVHAGERAARVELRARRVLRFPVEEGESPIPPDATLLRLASQDAGGPPPEGRARMEGTTLVVEGARPWTFSADVIAPDDSYASAFAPGEVPLRLTRPGPGSTSPERPRPISFRRSRRVEVLALRPDGSPAEGMPFVVRENVPLTTARLSDASGRVEFSSIRRAGEFGLFLLEDASSPWAGRRVAALDLRTGDDRATVIVPDRRSFRARVMVNGRDGLPPRIRLSVDGVSIHRVREDPAAGTLEFDARLDRDATAVEVSLNAYPMAESRARVAPVPVRDPIEVVLALRRPGALSLRIREPSDGDYELRVERWDPAESRWQPASTQPFGLLGPRPGADGGIRFEPLDPGTYRVRDAASGLASAQVEVRAGESADLPALDLSHAVWVMGRVLGPDGEGVSSPQVAVEGADLAPEVGWQGRSASDGLRIGRTSAPPRGTFRVRVPGDRPVTLRPRDPLLVPADVGGSLTVMGPRDDVVLRFVEGREATVRLVWEGGPPRWLSGALVRLFRGPPSGAPEAEHTAVVDGDRLRFGGFRPGLWTVWVDLPIEGTDAVAPAVLSDVTLGEGGARTWERSGSRREVASLSASSPTRADRPSAFGPRPRARRSPRTRGATAAVPTPSAALAPVASVSRYGSRATRDVPSTRSERSTACTTSR